MSGRRTIIVVEDSEDGAATIKVALEAIPSTDVVVLETAEAAMEALRATSVHALITDIHLPGIDGLELIRRLRMDSVNADLPIVVISADTDSRIPDLTRSAGANAFFAKPYSPAVVRRALEELIDAH